MKIRHLFALLTLILAMPLVSLAWQDDAYTLNCIYAVPEEIAGGEVAWRFRSRVDPNRQINMVETISMAGPFSGRSSTDPLYDFEIFEMGESRLMDTKFRSAAKQLGIDLNEVQSISHFQILDDSRSQGTVGVYKFNGKRGGLGAIVYHSNLSVQIACLALN